ncbi:DUF6896 domain-containing protein [Streptomyces adelaidensis]|uniref:DUF6896 domain-containing protein n=1 Tax=Streptomyces adelaidensis TaxID=2796465 RepID=UPI001905BA8B|nr:hypothetical protein [Streptomyces adelaidensis]
MTSGETPATEVVRAFLESHRTIEAVLARRYPEFSALPAVLAGVRERELGREGRTADGFTYKVHGRGCRMSDPDWRVVDIDLLPDGSEAFDPWRLEQFARSRGDDVPPRKGELIDACRELKEAGALREPETGWFGSADRQSAAQRRSWSGYARPGDGPGESDFPGPSLCSAPSP